MEIYSDRQQQLAPAEPDAKVNSGVGQVDPQVATRYVGLTLEKLIPSPDQLPKAAAEQVITRLATLEGGQPPVLQDGKTVGAREGPSVAGLPTQTQPGQPSQPSQPSQPLDRSLGDKAPQPQGISTPPNSAFGVPSAPNLEEKGFNNAGAGKRSGEAGSGEAAGRPIGLPLVGAGGDQVERSPAVIRWRPNGGGRSLELSLVPQPGQTVGNVLREVAAGSVEFPSLALGPRALVDPKVRLDLKTPTGDPGGAKPHEVRLVGRAESVAIGGRQSIASDDKVTPDAVLTPLAGAPPTRHEQELAASRSLAGQMVAEMLILARLRRRPARDPLFDGDDDLTGTAQAAQISLRNLYPFWSYPIEFDMRVARYIKSRRRDKRRAKKDDQDERQDQQP